MLLIPLILIGAGILYINYDENSPKEDGNISENPSIDNIMHVLKTDSMLKKQIQKDSLNKDDIATNEL